MKLVSTGLGDDLDAVVSGGIVLGGEGVLVEADFLDGVFGRKVIGGESVNIELRAEVGAGHEREKALKVARSGRQGIEVRAAQDHSSQSEVGAGVNVPIGDRDVLAVNFNFEVDGER